MNARAEVTGKKGGEPRGWFWLAVVLAGSVTAISAQSFWIDEANTAWKAMQPTFALWWEKLLADRGSDLQMPLYMIFVWGWGKLFGVSELALRAANLPWLWLGLLAWWRAQAGARSLARGMTAAVLGSAFTWFYLNDARPYAMQIGMALALLAACWRLAETADAAAERRWAWVLCASAVVLSGSSLLAMIFCGALLGAALLAAGRAKAWRLARAQWLCWAVMLAACGGLGLYYLWTLKSGARAATGGKTDLRNVAFAAYELLGFSGLGPGRTELRAGRLGVFRPHLALLVPYAAMLALVIAEGLRRLKSVMSGRALWSWAVVIAAAVLFLFAVGVKTQFRVLGRHFAPLLPLAALVMGAGLAAMVERRGWRRWAAGVFVALALVSSLEMRFAQRHAKDAYREVAVIARAALARGETVWWMGEPRAAGVYGVPLGALPGEAGKASGIQNPLPGFAAGLKPPDWIFFTKPDIYDTTGALAEFIAATGYRREAELPAFTVWRKSVAAPVRP